MQWRWKRRCSVSGTALVLLLSVGNVQSQTIVFPTGDVLFQADTETPVPPAPDTSNAPRTLKPPAAPAVPESPRSPEPAKSPTTAVTPPLHLAGEVPASAGGCHSCDQPNCPLYYRDRPEGKKEIREGIILNNRSSEPEWYRYYRCQHYGYHPTHWRAWPEGWMNCRNPQPGPHPYDVKGYAATPRRPERSNTTPDRAGSPDRDRPVPSLVPTPEGPPPERPNPLGLPPTPRATDIPPRP